MKILFVCTANVDRSKTAEIHFSKSQPRIEFKSAGTSENYTRVANSTFITQDLINWADIVVCMEEKHAVFIQQNFNLSSSLYTLALDDVYTFNSPELIKKLESSVLPILESNLLSK